jgi:hypothetical protein
MKRGIHGRRAALVLSGLVTALVMAATASASVAVSTVRATQAFEWLPVSNGSNILAWTQRPTTSSPASANDVWARVNGGPAFRVNSTGSAYSGGMSGNVLVYQSVVNGQSNIRMVNLITRANIPVPAEVNTSAKEFTPDLIGTPSDGFLLFGRTSSIGTRLILFDLTTHHSTVLARGNINPGELNGSDGKDVSSTATLYASFKKCSITCDVHRYTFTADNFAGGTRASYGVEEGVTRAGPSVGEDGSIYFVQGGARCGNASIRGITTGGVNFLVTKLPSNTDSFHTYTVGDNTVFFDRHACGGDSNLYKAVIS